jgi:hypothetical protein
MINNSFTSKTRKEIAIEYGISTRTLQRWLKKSEINIPPGLIKPIHQRSIYSTFGIPGSYSDNSTIHNHSTGQ